ncbi:ABC-2 type transporter family protein [Bifidobacterium sp. DSM 109960]|uniref:ABC-2 type transporter family protein n=1 Tax=Bifidobacterium erythrocebi TaxID=2675325 RepID=A0A7Y0ETN6_9BIFI|nr:ABC transporter permease [Bifidobacterium sp. DSM 109960]NMM96203.1 ABC-2 type transporter family protein [Bifidobacterium sp. DSM 109960]
MTTFRTGWRIIAAHKLYMTFYVVWLCVMMVMMSFSVVSGSVRGDDETVFTTAKASVAVINRDTSDSGRALSESLRRYFAASDTVIELDDQPVVLQNAVATDHVDLIAIVPKGYAAEFGRACRQGGAVPKLNTVTSYSSSLGTMAQMEIDAFLDNVRISAASAVSGDGGGKTDDDGGMVAAAAGQVAKDKRNAVESGSWDVRVMGGDASDDAASEATGFAFTIKIICYAAFVAITVLVSVATASFSEANRRRRLAVCATPQFGIGLQQVLVCVTFSAAVWALYMLVSVGLMAFCGADLDAIPLGGYAMAAASAFAVILVAACFGYLLSAAGLSEIAVNGAANVMGLIIMFTSGMAFSPSIMPRSLIVIGKLLPGWWYCVSVDNALGVGTAQRVDAAAWAQCVGLVMLFGAAFVCLGLALRRIRMSEKG